jgi:phosphoserine phosphatase RsbU/P
MNWHDISTRLARVLRLQTLCLGTILASWAIFWAVERPVTNIRDLFIYVLIQVNLTALLLWPLRHVYQNRRLSFYWPAQVVSIVAISVLVVATSAAAIYSIHSWPIPFSAFLQQSWKFPFVANLVFAFGYEAYNLTTCRLRRHNLQLQQTIRDDSAERELGAEELKQALEIQRGLLPRQIPQLEGFEIIGAWEPAKIVGGDYYDVIPIAKDKLALCIADVAGKGVSAALLMANVQAAVRTFAAEAESPSRVCAQINSVLYANTSVDKFVTLFYGILDASTGTMRYTNAGHPRPIIIHADGITERLESGGALLGVFPDWKYEEAVLELQPGDLLLLFTDGITEATRQDGEQFGEDRLIAAMINSSQQSLPQMQAQLLDQIKNFCGSHMTDDATLVLLAASPLISHKRRSTLKQDTTGVERLQFAGAQL